MATSISADGASQYVSLRMNAGLVEYSTDQSIYTPIAATANWPVTINNTAASPGPSSILRVVFTQDLTITGGYGSTSGYFIAGSTYITFDGSNNFINITNIPLYPGFIKNGSTATSTNGYANVIVQNIKANVIGSSSLQNTPGGSRGGWICAGSFGRGALANKIINCTNNGVIAASCGGICGDRLGVSGGSVTITNCMNSGNIGTNGGGIIGTSGGFSGSVTITDCTSSGTIGNSGGGIAGATSAFSGSMTITNCTNTANIGIANSGGIVGASAGSTNGSVTITNCSNTGAISGTNSGGIVGTTAGITNGSVTITNCSNTGAISGVNVGGIIGYQGGSTNGLVTITKCFSTGDITGSYAGGIAGGQFAFNTSQTCTITNSYSTGIISGPYIGGIVGASVGYNNNATYTPVVNITNCYSLGTIATTCGGICGGTDGGAYTNTSSITITNCYSSGTLVDANSGIVAIGLPIITTKTNTYVAAGSWTDASANDVIALTGTPTNINTNNPGSTWTTIASGTPYVLSAYNAALYSPSSASAANTYTSAQGLFQPGYTYQLVYTSQVGNVATASVFTSKGTAPYYYSYNFNTFIITNSSGSSDLITSLINSSNGALGFTLPAGTTQYPCFLEGTKILCFENNQEIYRPVESLQKGDLVKTIYNGYMPICMMGTMSIYNLGNDYRVTNRLYKCSRENYPTLFEDLYITGCHSILVPQMTDDQWENTKAVNGNIYVTDNHFRLIACADEKAEPFNKEGYMNIYHIALDHHDICMNYGIYANGLLVESCSIEYLIKYSNLKILGEADCSASEEVHQLSNNMSRQLVDTY